MKSLQSDIAQGNLVRGSRLPSEKELARHYGVSQPTVREAVRALDLMGYLDVRHGSGVYVSGDTRDHVAGSLTAILESMPVTILQVLELRWALGELSAHRAAEHVTAAEIELMRRYLDASAAAVEHCAEVAEIVGPVVSFNLAVSAASRNPLLFSIEAFTIRLVTQIQLTAKRQHGREFWRERQKPILDNRRRLLGRLASHDPDGAVDVMTEFLRDQQHVFQTDPELAGIEVVDPLKLAGTLDQELQLPSLESLVAAPDVTA